MRAMLDVERAGGSGRPAPHPLRALPACGARPPMRLVVALGGIVLILDQATKWIALRRLPPGAPLSVIDGFFSLTLVMNPGLAFGMLGTVPPGDDDELTDLAGQAAGVVPGRRDRRQHRVGRADPRPGRAGRRVLGRLRDRGRLAVEPPTQDERN